jgi:hypothetical protein
VGVADSYRLEFRSSSGAEVFPGFVATAVASWSVSGGWLTVVHRFGGVRAERVPDSVQQIYQVREEAGD